MHSYTERAKRCLAQGHNATNSKRPDQYVQGVYPEHLTEAIGPYVFDKDMRRYVDFVGALGANILGYRHPKVQEAAIAQIKTGYVSGSLPNILEIEVAEMLCDMFHVERVRFLKTGNEATLAAVRIARAYSNKPLVISDGYHGHGDLWTVLTPPASGVKDFFSINKLSTGVNEEACGALVLETLELDDLDTRRDYIKSLCHRYAEKGIPIIHDEIVSGFRVEKFGITQKWELDPDIVVFGKAMANGFPIAAVCGKKELMDQPDYFISSTFGGEAVSLAAAKATIKELQHRDMKNFMYYAKRFQDRLNNYLKEIDLEIIGYGSRGMFPTTKNENAALFMQEACKAGLLFGKAYFFSWAHMEENIEEYVLNIVSDVVNRIKIGSVKLEGKAPQETFKRYA